MQLGEAYKAGRESPAKRTSIIFLNSAYQKVNISTVIKLLLRCKKLYAAMGEIKKILQNILQQDEAYFSKGGSVQKVLVKYETKPGLSLKEEDDGAIQKC